MSIPLTSICVGSFYAYLAVQGADVLVQDQYYAAGQSINRVIAAGREAQRMGLSGELTFASDRVGLRLTSLDGQPLPPVLTLQLFHPARASLDQTVTLVAAAAGQYWGALAPSPALRWDIALRSPDQRWSLSGSWVKRAGMTAHLRPTDVREAVQ